MHLARIHGEAEALQDGLAVDFGVEVFNFEHSLPTRPCRRRRAHVSLPPRQLCQRIRPSLRDPRPTSARQPSRRSEPSAPSGHLRSEEHTSELQSLMRISYAVFCLKKTTYICNNLHSAHHI